MAKAKSKAVAINGQDLFEAKATEILDRVCDELDLGWLSVRQRFNEHPSADGADTIAETAPQWEYRIATIIWNVEVGVSQTDEKIERVVIHELVHALMSPLWSELSAAQQNKLAKQNELATENVTRAIQAARRR